MLDFYDMSIELRFKDIDNRVGLFEGYFKTTISKYSYARLGWFTNLILNLYTYILLCGIDISYVDWVYEDVGHYKDGGIVYYKVQEGEYS